MKKLAILHYNPLEYYPPITNLLNFLGDKLDMKTRTWTCNNIKSRKQYRNDHIAIRRVPFPDQREHVIVRLLKYWQYNLGALVGLIMFKPAIVMYYESYSAWPAYVYLRYFNRTAKLFIHFHEYLTPKWYQDGMRIALYYHALEKKYLFDRANWISQTNIYRRELFLQDHRQIDSEKVRVLSNYPPVSWANRKPALAKELSVPTRFVYVGSLSLEATYLKEFCHWILGQKGNAIFHIYSYNVSASAMEFIESLNDISIELFKAGIEYDAIPELLHGYDVGVVFYKPYGDNVIYCVSNKFYEYLACGLDIWFSSAMKATWPFENPKGTPRILKVDFEHLDEIALPKHPSISGGKTLNQDMYVCENEYKKLIDHF